MPAYASFYNAPASQQAFLTREQKRERKRKREGSDDDDDQQAADERSPAPEDDTSRDLHPVNRTDPYYVAGHPRDKPLPGSNFPHAATKEYRPSEVSVEEELAKLNPPLFTPKVAPQDNAGSFKRRHLDNLTAILHNCMLHQDWDRASRVWGLILRSEIQGYGPDIRRNGHWTIGAEILMRRGQTFEKLASNQDQAGTTDSDSSHVDEDDAATVVPVPSDEGFALARKYYERLVLQYPDRPRASHTVINALAIYPALFSIWIYEVQDQANRARRKLGPSEDTSEMDASADPGSSDKSDTSNYKKGLSRIRICELEGALAIVQRMDDLILNPPYDTSPDLLRGRGMVGLWLSDLHGDISYMVASGFGGSSSDDDDAIGPWQRRDSQISKSRHREQSDMHRQKARRVFEKMVAAKMDVPAEIQEFLDAADDTGTLDEDDSG